MLIKPPPPPPKLGQHIILKPKASVITGYKDIGYQLPMADTYTPAWVRVLQQAGYPTEVLVIDFETFFDDDTPESTIEKVMDKNFEVLSCTFTHMRGEYPFADYEQQTQFIAGEEAVAEHIRYLQGQFGGSFEAVATVAQNLVFDASILGRRYGLHPKYLIDILGLARHLNSRQKNDLAHLCKQYNLKEKGDTAQFKGLTFRTRFQKPKGRSKGPKLPLPVPRITDAQLLALRDYNTNDNLREWELFTILLPQINNARTELRIMQLTLELFTKPELMVDFAKGDELIRLYNQQIDQAIAAVQLSDDLRYRMFTGEGGLTREHISGDKTFESLLTTALELAGDQPQKYYKFCKVCAARPNGLMPALAKDDPERKGLLTHPDATVRQLMAAHCAIDSWPLHIKRVQRIMDQARAAGGKLPVPLKYHGAHTGRDSGGEKINLQNLSSRGEALLVAIRTLLMAPDDHTLVIVDASQVEARGTDWIAGQADSVERWRNNEDQYSLFATSVLGFPVRKPSDFEKKNIPAYAKKLSKGRDFGKVGVLGCGFGMGWEKAIGFAKSAYNVDLDEPTSRKLIEHYRATHPQVVQFWRYVEKAFADTARYHRPNQLPRGLRFDPYNEVGVLITLPNGRELHYPRVKLEQGRFGDTISIYNAMEHSWEHTWGGALTENIVQAFCRDILMEAMLRLQDDHGFRTVHRIHDELVMCVGPLTDHFVPEEAIEIAEREMARTPVWAPGLPLGAEGKISKVYCK